MSELKDLRLKSQQFRAEREADWRRLEGLLARVEGRSATSLSDEELLALPRYRQSDLFTAREKLALDYAVAVMRTPVEVTDALFTRMREQFSEKQLVELTALLTVVSLDRFNAAFGVGSAGFSEGMVCVAPDRPTADPTLARIA